MKTSDAEAKVAAPTTMASPRRFARYGAVGATGGPRSASQTRIGAPSRNHAVIPAASDAPDPDLIWSLCTAQWSGLRRDY